jgi:hypothetical protein
MILYIENPKKFINKGLKISLFWGWVAQGKGNEGGFGECILHAYMKIEE